MLGVYHGAVRTRCGGGVEEEEKIIQAAEKVETERQTSAAKEAAEKSKNGVIPRSAATRNLSFLPDNRERGIPHFVRNDAEAAFFRSL